MTLVFVWGSSCGPSRDARQILDEVYDRYGADHLTRSSVAFQFRGDEYVATRDGGLFSYERIYEDSVGTIRDYITNEGSFREINGNVVEIDDRTAGSILTKINSVVYFASLPLQLKDPAVRTRYLGTTEIEGHDYHKIEVTFIREGGGPDYQDRFVYWVDQETDLIDYFAYFYLTDGGGSRFRRVVNPRDIGGFRFVDHVNYAAVPDTIGRNVDRFDELLGTGALEIVSEVKHENVRVVPLH
ncbi:MAG: DUF6503 family protein [Rhodothermales bacterium]|nr:DUF6503 family protein [Rhodothermales bacterium]